MPIYKHIHAQRKEERKNKGEEKVEEEKRTCH